MRTTLSTLAAAVAAATFSVSALATPITTDVIAVVDESGSMGGEHAWLSGMISGLDAGLITRAAGDPVSAQYGLVGFGGSSSHGTTGHQHNVGGGQFGTATEFGTATSGLTLGGYSEDGYSGINTALNYNLRGNAATNIILVTDEDRDVEQAGLNYSNILSALQNQDALLNAVLNISVSCGDGRTALGVSDDGAGGLTGYTATLNGGFTSCTGATVVSGFGTTVNDYVNLALASGGAAWDLNQLRAGGQTAASFTAAFIDIKVEEIVTQQVPEPAGLGLLGLGLAGLGFMRKRKDA